MTVFALMTNRPRPTLRLSGRGTMAIDAESTVCDDFGVCAVSGTANPTAR
jgi:hypothetical protein